MLHDLLWQLNADISRRCLDHPFVRGLADGTLAGAAFRAYVAQDTFFLHAFSRAYALAAVKTTDAAHVQLFQQLMTGVSDELELHAVFAAELGIDLDHVSPYAATSAYTEFLLHNARHQRTCSAACRC